MTSHMSSSGSSCLEISEPKTAHSTLLSTYSGLFMAQQANSSLWLLRWSQGFKRFFCVWKTTDARVSQYGGDLLDAFCRPQSLQESN